MVNREKYHGFYSKLDKVLKLGKDEIYDFKLTNLHDFVKKNIPEVYNEMMSQERFKDWLDEDIDTGLIHIIRKDNKKVGFAAFDVADIKSICLSKIYILENYRGNNLLGDLIWELNDFRLNKGIDNNFILTIKEPNLYTIKSLIKAKIIFPISPTLYLGLLSFFNIHLMKHEHGSVNTITPFYSLELASPVQVIQDQLIYGGLSFIDDEDFNAGLSREEFLNNPEKVEQLKQTLKTFTNDLGELALKEVGDTSHLFART